MGMGGRGMGGMGMMGMNMQQNMHQQQTVVIEDITDEDVLQEGKPAPMEQPQQQQQQPQMGGGLNQEMMQQLMNSDDPKWRNSKFLKFIDKIGKGEIEFKDNQAVEVGPKSAPQTSEERVEDALRCLIGGLTLATF